MSLKDAIREAVDERDKQIGDQEKTAAQIPKKDLIPLGQTLPERELKSSKAVKL